MGGQDYDNHILRTLRAQAWERAKGELRAVLSTYWGGHHNFPAINEKVTKFISEIDDEGLAE